MPQKTLYSFYTLVPTSSCYAKSHSYIVILVKCLFTNHFIEIQNVPLTVLRFYFLSFTQDLPAGGLLNIWTMNGSWLLIINQSRHYWRDNGFFTLDSFAFCTPARAYRPVTTTIYNKYIQRMVCCMTDDREGLASWSNDGGIHHGALVAVHLDARSDNSVQSFLTNQWLRNKFLWLETIERL